MCRVSSSSAAAAAESGKAHLPALDARDAVQRAGHRAVLLAAVVRLGVAGPLVREKDDALALLELVERLDAVERDVQALGPHDLELLEARTSTRQLQRRVAAAITHIGVSAPFQQQTNDSCTASER